MPTPSQRSLSPVDPRRLRLDDPEGASGTLLGMRCLNCGVCVFGDAIFCQACSSDELVSVDLSSRGVLYSYTIVRVPPDGWPGPVPYVLGEVELPEGPHVLAEVIDIEHADLQVGLEVRLALEPVQSGESGPILMVYKWAPSDVTPALPQEG